MAISYGQFTGWVSVSYVVKSEPSCTSHKPRASYQRWLVRGDLVHGICPHATTQSHILGVRPRALLRLHPARAAAGDTHPPRRGYNPQHGQWTVVRHTRDKTQYQTSNNITGEDQQLLLGPALVQLRLHPAREDSLIT